MGLLVVLLYRWTVFVELSVWLWMAGTEWQFVEWALNAYQKVGVSLYDTLGKDAVGAFFLVSYGKVQILNDIILSINSVYNRVHVRDPSMLSPIPHTVAKTDIHIPYSINHAHLTIIFATANHIPDLLKLASRTPQVKMIVAIDELLPEQKQVLVSWGETQNVQIKELHECESRRYFEILADH